MRQVVSLSLPAQMTKGLKSLSKKRGFASVSDYIKQLIEQDKDLISVDELLVMVKKAEKEYKGGRAVTADSLADLL
ncbi:MAG: ribbon-helix-helix protein, CopG family [Candidatus Falkowbacteria bacterium]